MKSIEIFSFEVILCKTIKVGKSCVFIDLDNTLYNYSEANVRALHSCFKAYKSMFMAVESYSSFEEKYRLARTKVTQRLAFQGACRSRSLAFLIMFEELGVERAYLEAIKFEEIYWKTLIRTTKAHPGAINFLSSCKSNGLKVCIITDMEFRWQVKKLKEFDLARFVDFIVTSEEVGHEKPHVLIFKKALEKVGLTSKDVFMVGDSLQKDIEGARSLGIDAFRVDLEE